jgi:hypothetical protein
VRWLNGCSRRILLLAAHPGEGRFTHPTSAVQTWRPALVFMPQSGHLPDAASSAMGQLVVVPFTQGPAVGYSMTSSARASSDCGTAIPSAAAVFTLITSSNLVGCSIGRSAGLAPLRILPA